MEPTRACVEGLATSQGALDRGVLAHIDRTDGRSLAGRLQGLVELQTSQTEFAIDPHENRLRRMRKGLELANALVCLRLCESGKRPPKAWLVTLTYAKPEAWQARHVSQCIDSMRKWAERKGYDIGGVWCAEMQDKRFRVRGELAIHYHLVVWLPLGVTLPKPDKQGWWQHGHSGRELVRKTAMGYLMKYASKGSEAPLPKGARIHGSFGLGCRRRNYTHTRRPTWLRERCSMSDRLRRQAGGGWVNLSTGEFCRSPWVAVFRDGLVHVRRREPCAGIVQKWATVDQGTIQ